MGLVWDDITMSWVDDTTYDDIQAAGYSPYGGTEYYGEEGQERHRQVWDEVEAKEAEWKATEQDTFSQLARKIGGAMGMPDRPLMTTDQVKASLQRGLGLQVADKTPVSLSPGSGNFRGSYGDVSGGGFGRLMVQPVANRTEQQVLNAIRQLRSRGQWTLSDLEHQLNDPTMAETVAAALGIDVGMVNNVFQKVLSTGVSGLLMALTGNFPLAAMGYFATDRVLGETKTPFSGWPGTGILDGNVILPMGIEVPAGLPNEIFNDFRFVCYDMLSGKWYPTDEIRPLAYQGGAYRWFCMDRVDGKLYTANWIKKPTIYV